MQHTKEGREGKAETEFILGYQKTMLFIVFSLDGINLPKPMIIFVLIKCYQSLFVYLVFRSEVMKCTTH